MAVPVDRGRARQCNFCHAGLAAATQPMLGFFATAGGPNEPRGRRSNAVRTKRELSPAEAKCRDQVHRMGEPSRLREGEWTVQCWPVHRDGWKREILRSLFHCCLPRNGNAGLPACKGEHNARLAFSVYLS